LKAVLSTARGAGVQARRKTLSDPGMRMAARGVGFNELQGEAEQNTKKMKINSNTGQGWTAQPAGSRGVEWRSRINNALCVGKQAVYRHGGEM